MKISKLSILFLALTINLGLLAQESQRVTAPVKEATVFHKGAKLTHTTTVTVQKGVNTITIEGLSPIIDQKSIMIKASKGVFVSSFEFSVDYLSAPKTENVKVKKWQDSIEVCRTAIAKIKTDNKIKSELLSFLKKGIEKNVSGSESGLGMEELVKNMDYYQTKALQLETEIAANYEKINQYETTLARLRSQTEQEEVKNIKTSGILEVTLSAALAGTTELTVSYFTTAAGWTPFYDMTITSMDQPIKISGKANVFQTTGLDWKKVKLTLSTATPGQTKVAPLFSTWFLFYQTKLYGDDVQRASNSYSYRGDNQNVKLNTVSDQVKVTTYMSMEEASPAAKTEISVTYPLYFIDGREVPMREALSIDLNSIKSREELSANDAMATYGSRASGGAVLITTKSMEDYIRQSDDHLNTQYDIEIPYTIPGNGKGQTIDLQTKETNAKYKYYCAPKLNSETFLLADIEDWEKLALLSAYANITYDGTYLGQTFINAGSTEKVLTLTLGTEPRVSVKREKLVDYSSIKVLGSDTKVLLTYRITVKNNQTKKINFVLKEQYPISKLKEIEVELLPETTTPTFNKQDIGVLTWEMELNAGETKTFTVSYSVKYPKDKNINLE